MAEQQLQLIARSLGGAVPHQLHLVELVDANDSARVLAVGPGLSAKTGRVRCVAQGQLIARENLVAVEVGNRYLRRRCQIEAVLGHIHVVLEVGKLTGSPSAVFVDQGRGPHFAVPMLLRV